jgi:two-component sensor histidine kinase
MTVKDNGVGFPDGIDYKNTESLGMQLVNDLVGQLDGTLELTKDRGTCFTVTFKAREEGI